MKANREAYIARIVHDLSEWSAAIDEYELMASRRPAEFQTNYEQNLRVLRERYGQLSEKLQELQNSAGEIGMELETGVVTAKRELREAFDAARRTMQKAA